MLSNPGSTRNSGSAQIVINLFGPHQRKYETLIRISKWFSSTRRGLRRAV
jgi:hypothetical protein